MNNELLAWARVVLAGIGAVFSGIVLHYLKRASDRKDDEEKFHAASHRRYERNFLRIHEHEPEYDLEVED